MAAERAIDLARKASQTALGWAGGSKKQKKSEAFAMTEEGVYKIARQICFRYFSLWKTC